MILGRSAVSEGDIVGTQAFLTRDPGSSSSSGDEFKETGRGESLPGAPFWVSWPFWPADSSKSSLSLAKLLSPRCSCRLISGAGKESTIILSDLSLEDELREWAMEEANCTADCEDEGPPSRDRFLSDAFRGGVEIEGVPRRSSCLVALLKGARNSPEDSLSVPDKKSEGS